MLNMPISPLPPPDPSPEPMPYQSLDVDQLSDYLFARWNRLLALKGGLALQPPNDSTKFAQRVVAHAIYSTWLDLVALGASPEYLLDEVRSGG